MDVGVTSAILASVVCLTVAIAILMRRPRRPLYSHFATFSIALFLWHAASLASRFGDDSISLWQSGAAVLIPPPAILFFRELLRDQGLASKTLARLAWVFSGVLVALNFSPWGDTLWLRVPAGMYVFVTLALVQRALFRHTRRARSETDRKRMGALFYGGLVALLLAGGELVPDIAILAALGHVAATFYVYFLYQSIVARRLIDLVELLGKAAVLAALTLMLATVYALLVVWVGSNRQGLWLFNTLVASFVILILYDQVRPFIEEATAKLLFRERYELRQVVRRLLRALRTTIGIEDMRDHVLSALHTSGRASQVAMYLATETELSFQLFGYRGVEPPKLLSISHQPTLLQELRRERRPLLQEHLMHRYEELPTLLTGSDPTLQRELERTAEAIAAMRSLHASLVIPMVVEDRIMGVLTLGAEHLSEAYSTDELASLLSLAEACAVVIENSHEYEKRRERDRLVAVGEMAAGMAHEIRNPLGAIKGAAQCLDPDTLPPDAQEFIEVIVEEVDRLNGVVTQFLEYARPLRGNPISIDVNDVVSATLRLMGREALPVQVDVVQDLAHDLPWVSVDPEHLKQVLINLLLNAVQAMPSGGRITVTTALAHAHLMPDFGDRPPRASHGTQVLI
ncbi:MAG TPA: histidine kinase dimerization/phospho-acceptor domain-containing protein, partial [Myxococcota bacterium]|nr:histidine kinase dimerization/phospho-acceptor domain-containing protein [Myxococcota bacterium]